MQDIMHFEAHYSSLSLLMRPNPSTSMHAPEGNDLYTYVSMAGLT